MGEHQTAQFAVVGSLVMACILLGLIIAETWRKLIVTREELERVRRLVSKSYSHRKCLEDAVFGYVKSLDYDKSDIVRKKYKLMWEAAKWSKEDHD